MRRAPQTGYPRISRGDYVELDGPEGDVRGLVTEVEATPTRRYIAVYSYASREVTRFRLDRRGRLHHVEDETAPEGSDADSAEWESVRRSAPAHLVAAPIAMAVVAAALLSILVLPLLQAGFTQARAATTEFDDFIARDMGLPRLVSEVSARMTYRIDLEDYWSAPRDAWASRGGDCEDHAMVISAYLSHRGVSHSVVSFALNDGLQGHVVVVAKTDRHLVLLDTTLATAPTGLRRFPLDVGIADVVSAYGALPATDYGAAPQPGRPKPVGFID